MSMATDIATIAADVRWIKERAEKADEREEKLESRVTELEKGRIRTSAWAAGFGAAAAFVFSLVKDKLVAVLLAAFVSGCVGSVKARETQSYKWYEPEVQYVINQDMPFACVAAAEEAELFWSKLGVDYLRVRYAPGSWHGFNHCPNGSICVTVGDQYDTGGLTWARTWQHDRGAMSAAEIEFNRRTCEDVYDGPRMAIHELGHGLGLDDLYVVPGDVKNVMFHSLIGVGFIVTSEQLQWVRP